MRGAYRQKHRQDCISRHRTQLQGIKCIKLKLPEFAQFCCFDQLWSTLISFDLLWSSLIYSDHLWSTLISQVEKVEKLKKSCYCHLEDLCNFSSSLPLLATGLAFDQLQSLLQALVTRVSLQKATPFSNKAEKSQKAPFLEFNKVQYGPVWSLVWSIAIKCV